MTEPIEESAAIFGFAAIPMACLSWLSLLGFVEGVAASFGVAIVMSSGSFDD